MSVLKKLIYLLSNGAAYTGLFELNKDVLRLFFYSAFNVIPLILLFAYFGFPGAALWTGGVFLLWFLLVYSLTRKASSSGKEGVSAPD